jgi:hypothetical protein
VVDRAVADELREACMSVALQMGGWEKRGKTRNGRFKQPPKSRAAAR